ncbi:MAG: hypothetical protein U9Q69_06115 [Nanoarchaeota archaeon]|nr:hypothetical protein [Nanoarchaeota archaeon]
MKKFRNLAEALNILVAYDPKKIYSPKICPNPDFNECSCKRLLEGHLYLFIPGRKDLQERIKEKMKSFAEKERFHHITTTQRLCKGNWECYGHYVDPFKEKNDGHVFVDEFPEELNGAYVHFLNEANYEIFMGIKG